MSQLQVQSEIGKLQRVLLHRPGMELENITPSTMERLLFDDIPYLEVARREHDAFADTLRGLGTEVVYLEDLVNESITDKERKHELLAKYLADASVFGERQVELYQYLNDFQGRDFVDKLIAGVRASEIPGLPGASNWLHIDPIPNLYFTRDPFAVLGGGVSIHRMATVTRNRETLFGDFIFRYHPELKDVARYYNRDDEFTLEGGDIILLSDSVLAVGVSQRTSMAAIMKLAKNMFKEHAEQHILAFHIPNTRAFMHLDTVFTMVDFDKFTIHPEVEGPLVVEDVFMKDGQIIAETQNENLENILKKYLKLDHVELIRCGGGLGIDAEREQWNDGSNTLTIAPGEVIVYERNHVTNRLLEKAGIKIHEIISAELSRGRGGPRCMSMSLNRKNIY